MMNSLLHRVRKMSQIGFQSSTIYALATGGIRCALAVIRVSGPETSQVLLKLGRYRSINKLPEPRKATVRTLYDPFNNTVIDKGMLIWFPGPKSYTGEDSCEFHVHGGPSVISSLLQSISKLNNCRLAEPGEFTRRAFLNGKMNLTEVDGLIDLIHAETEKQRVQALKQMTGSLTTLYESWRNSVAKCVAHAEAYIDFGEDELIETNVMRDVENQVNSLICAIESHINDGNKGQRLRNGIRVAIIGEPNVGKSSLLNLLCDRRAAIVSDIPGTTRDVIESCVNLEGFPVIFVDTAGIRETPENAIEKEGIERAVDQIAEADIIILMTDLQGLHSGLDNNYEDIKSLLIQKNIRHTIAKEKAAEFAVTVHKKSIVVVNKIDLSKDLSYQSERADCFLSCKTCEGLHELMNLLSKRIATLCSDPCSEPPYITQERYRSHLCNTVKHLRLYLDSSTQDLALKTQHLKNAMNAIGCITGHYGTEDILDIVFKDFCVGK